LAAKLLRSKLVMGNAEKFAGWAWELDRNNHYWQDETAADEGALANKSVTDPPLPGHGYRRKY
jgi:hypothetical protein